MTRGTRASAAMVENMLAQHIQLFTGDVLGTPATVTFHTEKEFEAKFWVFRK